MSDYYYYYPFGRCTAKSFVGNFRCDRACDMGKKLCATHQRHADQAEATRLRREAKTPQK